MIKENQRLLNYINILSDAFVILISLPLAFLVRFYIINNGIITIPLENYLESSLLITLLYVFTLGAFGMYRSFRTITLLRELSRLWVACLLDMSVIFSYLFITHSDDYSRLAMSIFFCISLAGLSVKRWMLRSILRSMRAKGYNLKHIIILGSGDLANSYLNAIRSDPELGFSAVGYVDSVCAVRDDDFKHLGSFDELEQILEKYRPDEVISAIRMEDYPKTPMIISICEKVGIKLSIIPYYADYISSTPQFDEVGGIPLLNIRRVPLDNLANAAAKRLMDIVGSALLILLTSPIMLFCAIGVYISSPGPILFCQERVGRNKKIFKMYKFRSMRVNNAQNTAWSSNHDDRKTKFGAFIRKFSLDEFPQFFNVLKGDMSLVGPRPEIPFYVEQFKEDVPLYMVKHLVRPGITGWAQVNGFRGDTSIKGRIDHDIYYIEHWNLLLDMKILLMTVFGGKFVNSESLH